MNEPVFAVPVKYMVVEDSPDFLNRLSFMVLDTSYEGQGRIVCQGLYELKWAHHVCKLLNNAEGFKYAY